MQTYRFLSSNWLTITTVHSGKKTTPLLNHNALLAPHTRNTSTRFAVNLRTAPREILYMSRDVIKSVHNEIENYYIIAQYLMAAFHYRFQRQ